MYSFLAPARAVVGCIVREKELRLREGMQVMGACVACVRVAVAAACRRYLLLLLLLSRAAAEPH